MTDFGNKGTVILFQILCSFNSEQQQTNRCERKLNFSAISGTTSCPLKDMMSISLDVIAESHSWVDP